MVLGQIRVIGADLHNMHLCKGWYTPHRLDREDPPLCHPYVVEEERKRQKLHRMGVIVDYGLKGSRQQPVKVTDSDVGLVKINTNEEERCRRCSQHQRDSGGGRSKTFPTAPMASQRPGV